MGPHPCGEPCQPAPSLEALQHWQVVLVQSPVRSLSSPLGLGVHKVLFVPSKTEVSVSLSPLEGH